MGDVNNYGNCWNCLGQPLLVSDHWFAHAVTIHTGGWSRLRNLCRELRATVHKGRCKVFCLFRK
jgi:hypothetical protein